MTDLCGTEIMARLEQLAACSEDSTALTRTFLTPQHKAAALLLQNWMEDAGMQAGFDPIGNMVGRYAGAASATTTGPEPVLLIGSHYDTVRNAGKYDGMYGIIAGIAAVKALHQRGERLPFAIEIIGFADEEGVRFGSTLLGSRAVAGNFDLSLLDKTDADGVSMRTALRDYGLDPGRIGMAAHDPDNVLAYVETHIEQGPVLLSENLPVGIVTAIAGATRFQIKISGQAGHAGTVPMALRRDAAVAAAEALLFVEQRCQSVAPGVDSLVGTVGQLNVPAGAANVIPGCVEFSLDVRAGEDAIRHSAVDDILTEFKAIEQRRQVQFEINKTHDAPAVACAPWLMQQLESAISRAGIPPRYLPSGAGHDAMAFSGFCDIAMLFVRCGNGGISHHPDEQLSTADAVQGATLLLDFIRNFQPKDR